MTPHRRWLTGTIAVAVLATVLAWIGGPRPARLGDQTTGDPVLAASVRDAIGDPEGYRGLAVAVVEDREEGTVRFAGLGDAGRSGEVDERTAFEIGSVTKALTGMLLADLVRDGTVRADEPLQELLPGIQFADPGLAETTLAELASHRSGLPRLRITSVGQALGTYLRNLRGHDPYGGQDTTWLRSSIAGARAGSGEHGVSYSNYGLAVLGHALAERAGSPYPELLTRRILEPLGMRDTGFHLDGAALPAHRAHGGTAGGRAMAPWRASGNAPAGNGAWSTAEDLAKLVSAMLAGTAPGADAATPRFEETDERRIGYGWFTDRADGQEITWHNGGTGGFRSFVGFDPAAGRGVVVLGNTDRPVDQIGRHLLRPDGDEASGAESAGLFLIAFTVGLSLVGGLGQLFLATRAVIDRLRLVSNGVWAVALPAIAYPFGAWQAVPTWVWAVGVGLSAAALAWTVRRWRDLPIRAGGRTWLRWAGAAISAGIAAAAVAWVLI